MSRVVALVLTGVGAALLWVSEQWRDATCGTGWQTASRPC